MPRPETGQFPLTGEVDDSPAGRLRIHPLDPWYHEINSAAKAGGSSWNNTYYNWKMRSKQATESLRGFAPITVSDSTRVAIDPTHWGSSQADTVGVVKGEYVAATVRLRPTGREMQSSGTIPAGAMYGGPKGDYPSTAPDSSIWHGREANRLRRLGEGAGWWHGRSFKKKAREHAAAAKKAQQSITEEIRRRAREGK